MTARAATRLRQVVKLSHARRSWLRTLWAVMTSGHRRNPARVVVSIAGHVIADTRNALALREADYPAVQYIPREDVDLTQLEPTDHATYCPYKGDCTYYSVPAGRKKSVNAVWTYEDPFPAVEQIRGHVAFYPDRVDEIAEQPTM